MFSRLIIYLTRRTDNYRLKKLTAEIYKLKKQLLILKQKHEELKRVSNNPPSYVPDFTGRDLWTKQADRELVQSRKRRRV